MTSVSHDTTFLGYRRENGRVGVRNHVIVLPLDDLSNAAAEAVAHNIKGALAIPHPYGRLQFGADLELPPTELELPVRLGRHSVGRFLVDPTPGVIVPFDHRIVAVILTDHLAAALVSDRSAASPRS